MTIPARWRMIADADRNEIRSYRCGGDGVDECRAPACWLAERLDVLGQIKHVITTRCPDHIPVRALQSLVPAAAIVETKPSEKFERPSPPPSPPPHPPGDENDLDEDEEDDP